MRDIMIKWKKGGVDEWSDNEEEEGDNEGDVLFQSEFSLSVSWCLQSELFYSACFSSRFSTRSIHHD